MIRRPPRSTLFPYTTALPISRRSRHYQNARERHRTLTRQKTLREVEHEKRADVDELRDAQSWFFGEEAGEGSPSEEKPQGEVERRATYPCSTGRERAHEPGEDDRRESHPGGRDGVRRGQRVDEETCEREAFGRARQTPMRACVFVSQSAHKRARDDLV